MDSSKTPVSRTHVDDDRRTLFIAAVGVGAILALGIFWLRRPSEPQQRPVVEAVLDPTPAPVEETVAPAPMFPVFEHVAASPEAPIAPARPVDAPFKQREDGTWSGGPVLVAPQGTAPSR